METKEVVERSGEAGPDIKKLEANERQTGDVEDSMKGGGLFGEAISQIYIIIQRSVGQMPTQVRWQWQSGISQDKNATYFY